MTQLKLIAVPVHVAPKKPVSVKEAVHEAVKREVTRELDFVACLLADHIETEKTCLHRTNDKQEKIWHFARIRMLESIQQNLKHNCKYFTIVEEMTQSRRRIVGQRGER